jgi:trigger factor
MKVFIQKIPKSKVELKIEVPAKDFDKFLEKATFDLGKDLEIKGFRKGKAPREIIEKEIGQEIILREAAKLAIKENYLKAILENEIEAIDQPEIEILKLAPKNPLEFKARVSVLPKIELPDYKKIASKVKKRKVSVEEKEVKETLDWLQKSRAKFILKKGPAKKGDFVQIQYDIKEGDFLIEKEIKDAFILGKGQYVSGFEENLEGMLNGQEKEFSLNLAKDYHKKEIAGKNLNFKVKMNSVQKVEFPEISDEFAKNLGNFENLEALKKSIKEGIFQEKKIRESQRVREEILEKIGQNLNFEIPEILIEEEKKIVLENLKKEVSENLKIPFPEYLEKIKKSEKELLDPLLPQIKTKIKNFLILREISKKENIEVSEKEVEEKVNQILKNYPTPKIAEKELDLDSLKEYIREEIKNEKTLKLLESCSDK